MKDLSTFQIAFLGGFILLGIFGLGFFAFHTNSASQDQSAPVVIWGTMDETTFHTFLDQYTLVTNVLLSVKYTSVPENQISARLTEALSNNQSPDVVLAPQDSLSALSRRLYTIPFDSYPDRNFKDAFIDQASLYETPTGIIGLPLTIDPLVLYWNRDLLSAQNMLSPSTSWGDFYLLAPRFLKRDSAGNITQSLVGLGTANNVNHLKDILAALLLQTGNPIVADQGAGRVSTVAQNASSLESPAISILRFFTEFSNPNKAVYSWNRSLPNSLDFFSTGKLAYYIGPASDLAVIKAKNPYLNFDVATLPNVVGAPQQITFGRMSALSLVARTTNSAAAFNVMNTLTSPQALAILSQITKLPPVSRSLVANPPRGDVFAPVFYTAAAHSRGWFDPSPTQTTALFITMVESAVSGRKSLSDAVIDMSDALSALLQ